MDVWRSLVWILLTVYIRQRDFSLVNQSLRRVELLATRSRAIKYSELSRKLIRVKLRAIQRWAIGHESLIVELKTTQIQAKCYSKSS